jgi:hypothetical protein
MMDEKGRCCGVKPIHYKGGSWRSPPGSPMYFCCRCSREYDGVTKAQRSNFAWKLVGAKNPVWTNVLCSHE